MSIHALRLVFFPIRAIQRQIDLITLWPVIRQESPSLKVARECMFMYMCRDRVWTTDYTESELSGYVKRLQ